MTQRIALSIFLTVGVMLIIGGLVAYLMTRSILLSQLDESLVDRALSVPAVVGGIDEKDVLHAPYAAKNDRYIVRTASGRTLASVRAGEQGVSRPHPLSATFFRMGDGSHGRSITVRTTAREASPGTDGVISPVTITYSGSCEQFDAAMFRLGLTLILCVASGGAIAAVVAVQAASVALRPLRETAAVIREIDEQQLHRRLAVEDLPPELRPVAGRLNEMLARLEAAVEKRRRFLADTSHELRTPLAAMGAALQVTLRRPRAPGEYQEAMEACLSEARHLRHLVDLLTAEAQGDAVAEPALVEGFDLLQLMRDCATLGASLGADRNIDVVMREPSVPDSIPQIRAAPYRLRSAVMNAVSNAVEYGRTDGHVQLTCSKKMDGTVVVQVCDDGIGIDQRHVPHLFEPFYRVDAARSADQGHFGLGLFIMQSHLHAMGGTCAIESEPGRGTTLQMVLPARLMVATVRAHNEVDSSAIHHSSAQT